MLCLEWILVYYSFNIPNRIVIVINVEYSVSSVLVVTSYARDVFNYIAFIVNDIIIIIIIIIINIINNNNSKTGEMNHAVHRQ